MSGLIGELFREQTEGNVRPIDVAFDLIREWRSLGGARSPNVEVKPSLFQQREDVVDQFSVAILKAMRNEHPELVGR